MRFGGIENPTWNPPPRAVGVGCNALACACCVHSSLLLPLRDACLGLAHQTSSVCYASAPHPIPRMHVWLPGKCLCYMKDKDCYIVTKDADDHDVGQVPGQPNPEPLPCCMHISFCHDVHVF